MKRRDLWLDCCSWPQSVTVHCIAATPSQHPACSLAQSPGRRVDQSARCVDRMQRIALLVRHQSRRLLGPARAQRARRKIVRTGRGAPQLERKQPRLRPPRRSLAARARGSQSGPCSQATAAERAARAAVRLFVGVAGAHSMRRSRPFRWKRKTQLRQSRPFVARATRCRLSLAGEARSCVDTDPQPATPQP